MVPTKRLILLTTAGLALVAVAGGVLYGLLAPPRLPPDARATALGPDWNCYSMPTSFDAPGAIIRVTPAGAAYSVSAPARDQRTETSVTVDATFYQTFRMAAGLIANIIEIPLDANASADTAYAVKTTYRDARAVNTTDDDVAPVLEKFSKRSDIRPDDTYYLIRSSVTAKQISYDFDRKMTASFAIDLLTKMASAHPQVSGGNEYGYSFAKTFTTPVNVCLQAERLERVVRIARNSIRERERVVESPAAGGAGSRFAAMPDMLVAPAPRRERFVSHTRREVQRTRAATDRPLFTKIGASP